MAESSDVVCSPNFGAAVENVMASYSNPQRLGLFVRVVRRPRGQMNPGTWWEMTDTEGHFWQVQPKNCRIVGVGGVSLKRAEANPGVTYSRDEPVAKMVNGVVVDDPERDYWKQRRADEERELMRERDEEADPSILEGY